MLRARSSARARIRARVRVGTGVRIGSKLLVSVKAYERCVGCWWPKMTWQREWWGPDGENSISPFV